MAGSETKLQPFFNTNVTRSRYKVESRLLQGTAADPDGKHRRGRQGGVSGRGKKRFRNAVERVEAQARVLKMMESQRSAAARLHTTGSSSGTALAKKREQAQRKLEEEKRRSFHAETMTPGSRKLLARRRQKERAGEAGGGSPLSPSDRMHAQAMEARRKAQEASAKAAAERAKGQGAFVFSSEW
jgi:hypothetical protein